MKKMLKALAFVSALALLSGSFIACSSDDDDKPADPTYKVTYISDHGTAPAAVDGIKKGSSITLAAAMEKVEETDKIYEFSKWNDGTTDYAAGSSYTVNADATMKAVWDEKAKLDTSKTISSIEIETEPTKKEYEVGDTEDWSGLVVKVTYTDNTTANISSTDYTVTGFDSSAAVESQTITVTVGEKTATFTVIIKEKNNGNGGENAKLSPANEATSVYEDTVLSIEFDAAPTINVSSTAKVKIYNAAGAEVDSIGADKEKYITYNGGSNGTWTELNAQTNLIWVDGNSVKIKLHTTSDNGLPILANGATYKVEVPNGLISGKIDGKDFAGVSKDNWSFTTRTAPSISGKTITVGSNKNFSTIQGALSYICKNATDSSAWTVNVDAGTYHEILSFYSGKYPSLNLIGKGSATYGTDVKVEWMNANGEKDGTYWNPSTRARPIFEFRGTDLNVRNMSFENTVARYSSTIPTTQAETIYFDSTGKFTAFNSTFISKQDTLNIGQAGARAWIYKCYVKGEVDFMWGGADVCLFEECDIVADLREKDVYLFESRVANNTLVGKGYVLYNSKVTADGSRTKAYLGRQAGTATTYGQIAVIKNEFTSGIVADALWGAGTTGFIAKGDDKIQHVGWKSFGNAGFTDPALASDTTNKGTITQAICDSDYSNANLILNRYYDSTGKKYVNADSKWDLTALATEFSYTLAALPSDYDATSAKVIWDFADGYTAVVDGSNSTSVAEGKTGTIKGTITDYTGSEYEVQMFVDAKKLFKEVSSGRVETYGAILTVPVTNGAKVTASVYSGYGNVTFVQGKVGSGAEASYTYTGSSPSAVIIYSNAKTYYTSIKVEGLDLTAFNTPELKKYLSAQGTPEAKAINITTSSDSMMKNGSSTFAATVYSAYGTPTTEPTVTWSATGDVTVNASTGDVTANNVTADSTGTVTATISGTTISDSVTVKVIAEAKNPVAGQTYTYDLVNQSGTTTWESSDTFLKLTADSNNSSHGFVMKNGTMTVKVAGPVKVSLKSCQYNNLGSGVTSVDVTVKNPDGTDDGKVTITKPSSCKTSFDYNYTGNAGEITFAFPNATIYLEEVVVSPASTN